MSNNNRRTKIKYGRVALLVFLIASFVFVGAGLGLVVGALATLPDYNLDRITGDLSSVLYDKDGKEAISLKTKQNRIELNQNEIPDLMKKAIIAIEDQRFEKHHGVDFYRLGGAVLANITKGYGSEGASTITQQLVKTAILKNPEKKLRRKIQELYISLQLEHKYSKEQILAFYLNNVYYSHGAWSLETAAHTYFGKDAKNLDLAECAMLAGVINAPNRYSPYLNPDKAKQRRALVLTEMVKMKYITKEDADKAKEEPFKLAGLKPNDYKYQSFIDYVIEEAADDLELNKDDISSLYTAGYRIYTTMDAKTQAYAESVYANSKNFPAGKKGKIVQSAMVILDPHNGEIRTLIGGRNQQGERQFNRAVDATRQPGSAMKPIAVYGPALEKGYGPATVLDDYPEDYYGNGSKKTFVNYDSRYRGLISMRTAIQFSVNTAAVKMLQKIGPNEGFNFAKSLGITTLVDSGSRNDLSLSLALGGLTKGVSPLELTAAYGAFDNKGIYVKPYAIRKIEDSEGNLIFENKKKQSDVMSAQTAYLMTDMLQTVVKEGTAKKAQLADRPVAGKTGTTSFEVDAWFVGYTPDLVGTVWLGYDKVEHMTNVSGGGNGAPIWKQIMTVAHKNISSSTFPEAEGITTKNVDKKSGLLPSSLTPENEIVSEKFNSQYVPTETSNVWVEQLVCADSKKLLTDKCPYPVTGVFLKRPTPWTGKTAPEDAYLEVPTEYCPIHGDGTESTSNSNLRLKGNALSGGGKVNVVRLNWIYPDASNTTYYQIYRSTTPNFASSNENRVGEVSGRNNWEDTHIAQDAERYYYRVVAQQQDQAQSVISNSVVISLSNDSSNDDNNNNNNNDITTLRAPRLSGRGTVDGDYAEITLSWSKQQGKKRYVYYIYRSEASGFRPDSSNQVALDETITSHSWVDTDVEPNRSYFYKIVAVDMETNESSPASNQVHVNVK